MAGIGIILGILCFSSFTLIVNKSRLDAYINLYLGISYFIGFAMCLIIIVIRGHAIKARALLYGLAGGILSYVGSYLYIRLMGVFPSALIVPLFSCGSIVLVTLCSVVIFREKISRRLITALFVGVMAVAALCI